MSAEEEIISNSHFAIGVAFASVGIAIASFVLNLRKTKMEKLTHESQFIRTFQQETSNLEESYLNIRSKTDCILYAWKYLNIFDRLCYFDTQYSLSDSVIGYFKNYLEEALNYYDFISKVYNFDEKRMKVSWPYLKNTCNKHSLKGKDKLHAPFNRYDSLLD